MHYILSPFGSAGDVFPMLGLALALKDRGHPITFLANGYFREAVERYGLDYVELGTKEQFLESLADPNLWHPTNAFGHIVSNYVAPMMRPQYDEFVKRYEKGKSVGIINVFGFGGLIAQDKIGMPMITLHMQPSVIWSDYAPPELPGMFGPYWLQSILVWIAERFWIDAVACPPINALRAELGLPAMSRTMHYWHSSYGVACLFPEWFAPPQIDWPKNLLQTDFPLWDEKQEVQMPAEAEAYLAAGEPPIVFTPGSANVQGKDFFAAAASACEKLQRRGILLTKFPEQIPAKLPPGVVHFSFVPLTLLLPRCAAFVNHGGVGSMSQAFAAGIPQVIMPMAHDQFDNASRVKRLGVGDSLEMSRFTGDNLAACLKPLLESPQVTSTCRTIAERLRPRDGLARMAEAIERRTEQGG